MPVVRSDSEIKGLLNSPWLTIIELLPDCEGVSTVKAFERGVLLYPSLKRFSFNDKDELIL